MSDDVARLRAQNRAAAARRDLEQAELQSKVARFERAFAEAREAVKDLPADWTSDPPAQGAYGLWRYGSRNMRVALAELARQRGEARDDRDRWIRLFHRLQAAVTHHRYKALDSGIAGAELFVDEYDETLWAAVDRIIADAAAGKG